MWCRRGLSLGSAAVVVWGVWDGGGSGVVSGSVAVADRQGFDQLAIDLECG